LVFTNECDPKYDGYEAVYTYLLFKTLRHLGHPDNVIVEVELVSPTAIRELNRVYRDRDQVTDVLSFAFMDEVPGELKIQNAPFVDLGSIVICLDQAVAQAASYGHGLERELSFLFVHGLLHLLGYDHQTATDEKKMFALQDEIIGKRIST